MPTYLPPRQGISQSQAYAEAAAFATAEAVLLTLALYHPSFTAPIYVVNDFDALLATIESTSTEGDASATVSFAPVPMEITLPAEGEDGGNAGEVNITISNVSRLLMPQLALAAQSSVPVTIIARVYLPSDLSAPHEMPPLRVTLRGATATVQSVTARAGFGDVSNRRFPALEYTLAEFPGLAT